MENSPEEVYVETKNYSHPERVRKASYTESWPDYAKRLVRVKVKAIDAGDAFVELVNNKAAINGYKPTEILASELVQREDWPPIDFAPRSCEEVVELFGREDSSVRNGCLSSMWSSALNMVRRRHCIRQ